MEKNGLFQIGDIAKLFHLSVGTLRHYEKLGLLQPEYIDPETCVTLRFCGSHADASAQYEKLGAFINDHNLEIAGFSKEITLIDYGITNDTDKFVTEIQIPVAI